MTTALAVQPDQKNWDATQLAALRQIGLSDAPAGDLALFLHYAQRTGLDPFSRQLYMIGRWDGRSGGNRYTIQSSIDGLRIIAQRSGEYAGQTPPLWCGEDGVWKDVWLSAEPPRAAKIGVYRAGFSEALFAVATMSSYLPTGKDGRPQGLWAKMPDVMLAKVAEALALRKAFPNDLSGIYTSEEMDQADAKIPPAPASKIEPLRSASELVAPVPADEEEIVVEMIEPLTPTKRTALVKKISNAKSKAELRQLWKDNADHLNDTWENPLGEMVSLKALIVTRQAEVPESNEEAN